MSVFVATVSGARQGGARARTALAPTHLYSVWDDRPFLLIGFADHGEADLAERCKTHQHIVPHDQSQHGAPPRGSERWWALYPVASSRTTVGEERRYGRIDVELTAPMAVSFACVVHPRKYFTPSTFRRMLDEIRDHFGWSIEWDSPASPVHSGTFGVSGEDAVERLVANIQQELQGVRQWLRVLQRDGDAAAAFAPEARLVAAWQTRRAKVLRTQIARQEVFLANAVAGSGGRALPEKRLQDVALSAERARLALRDLMGLAARQRLAHGPFALSPRMQRDHRLRRLLRAFAPTRRERWSDVVSGEPSELPPLKAADVFEYWCAAVLANAARECGWALEGQEGRSDQPDGGVPVFHQSTFRKDDCRLTICFQPDVAETQARSVDFVDVRGQQGVEAVAARRGDVDGLVAYGKETPDFALLLVLADGRRAFAIGDAALTDPARGGPREKIERMIRYRDRIAWRASGRTHRCQETCTFVMFPGPQSTWDGVLAPVPCDSVVLCADPAADPDLAVARRFAALMEHLERAAE